MILFAVELLLLIGTVAYKNLQPSELKNKVINRNKKISYSKDVVPVFTRNCNSCHSGSDAAGSLDFTNYDHVYISAISQTLISKEGKFPDCSGSTNSDSIQAKSKSVLLVKRWIRQGALFN